MIAGGFLAILTPIVCLADISHYDLKGVHDLVSQEYEHLSPVHGFRLLQTRELENRRFYGNYGPTVSGKCGSVSGTQIVDHLIKNHDCPQDSMSELIQRLFPSQDGVNFVANQISSDIVSHLDPETIGQILGRISKTNVAQDTHLKEDLERILFQGLNPKKFYEWEKSEIERQLKGCKKEAQNELKDKLVSIEEVLKTFQIGSASASGTEGESVRETKAIGRSKDFKEFADILVRALQESKKGDYPPHLVEQTLLAFFWKKGNGKEDFVHLLEGLHRIHTKVVNKSELLADEEAQDHFLKSEYQASEFNPESLQDSKKAAKELSENIEKMAFYVAQDQLSQTFPPVISYGSAKHSSLGDATYADCGETSLRNFLNIALFNPKTGRFDVEILKEMSKKNPELSIHPAVITYYTNHSDPGLASSQEARDAWSETVASKHEGVEYLRPRDTFRQCEINAGIDNMMSVLSHLLYHDKKPNPLMNANSRREKLNALCKTLSRDGFELSCESDKKEGDIPNTDIDIKLSVDGDPSFIWQFQPGHFALQEIHAEKANWKDPVGVELAQMAGKHPKAKQSLSFVMSERNWDDAMKYLPVSLKKGPEHVSHFYSLPLASTDTKLFAFRRVVGGGLEQSTRTLAQRLLAKVPQDDPHALNQIHTVLADADHPLGDPTHFVGQPDKVFPYRRVSRDLIQKKFGDEAARRMGISWSREMPWGYQMVLGEPLLDEKGETKKLNFEKAKEECLNLNSTENRDKVQTAFLQREEELKKLRDIYKSELNVVNPSLDVKGAFDKVYQSHPISGCYLPSREEWKVLESDFGAHENKYISQILPKLHSRAFSSSSDHPEDEKYSYYFNSTTGKVQVHSREVGMFVRCVCSAAAM